MQYESYLQHHGIKGMKWGVRRYQNSDGSLTDAGKSRYERNLDRLASRYEAGGHSKQSARQIAGRNLQNRRKYAKRFAALTAANAVAGRYLLYSQMSGHGNAYVNRAIQAGSLAMTIGQIHSGTQYVRYRIRASHADDPTYGRPKQSR